MHREAPSTRPPSTPPAATMPAHGNLRDLSQTRNYSMMLRGGQLPGRARFHHVSLAGGLRAREEGARAQRDPPGSRGPHAAWGPIAQDVWPVEPPLRGGRVVSATRTIRRSPRRCKRPGGEDCREGPCADTVFSPKSRGMYDLVVVMYHDQGHIRPNSWVSVRRQDRDLGGSWPA